MSGLAGCSGACRLPLHIETAEVPASLTTAKAVVFVPEDVWEGVITVDAQDPDIEVYYYPLRCDYYVSGVIALYADLAKSPEAVATIPPTPVFDGAPPLTVTFRRRVDTQP
jgi:hypothetical protein